MTITGLEQDYYLCRNNIWVTIKTPAKSIGLKVKNTTSEKELSFTLQTIAEECRFNIALPIRALFSPIDHLSLPLNTLQNFSIEAVANHTDTEKETQILIKNFVFGYKTKHQHTGENWHLHFGDKLHNNEWVAFTGVSAPIYPFKIIETGAVNYFPSQREQRNIPVKNSCRAKIVKFLNALGGYSYYVFENYQEKTEAKKGQSVAKTPLHLNDDAFLCIENQTLQTIEFYAKTPHFAQHLISELIASHEVFLFVPNGTTNNDRWIRLKTEDNECLFNSWELNYDNKITFSL